MTYNCLFTALTDPKLVDETLDHALAMAEAYDAHLEILCLGVDRSQTGYYYAGASALMLEQTLSQAATHSEEIEAAARAKMKGATILWSLNSGVAQLADLGRHVAFHARFCDLAVLPQPYGKHHGVELEPVSESVLFEGRAPALFVPDGVTPAPKPKNICVGWNESPEALTAIRAALPMMKAADKTHVVVIDPPAHGPSRSDPGGLISQYLARHGVQVEIDVLSKSLPRVADVLSRHATDMDADLIVMGAYGHSRFREAIFGGATRDMLDAASMPILMAH